MVSYTYDNTCKMLLFSKDAFFESSKYETDECDRIINDYISKNPNKTKDLIGDISQADTFAEKLLAGSAYISHIMNFLMKYILFLVKINKRFTFLKVFCDKDGKNLKRASRMMVMLTKISDASITDDELEDLARYISELPTMNIGLLLRVIGGLVIYADMIIVCAITIINLF